MKGRGIRRYPKGREDEEEERGGAKGRKCQGERISGKPRRGEGIAKGGGGRGRGGNRQGKNDE